MIDIKKITNSEYNGKDVWVCDLRYNDYSNKPIRNIKPIKVAVRSNEQTTKRVYYSESHFVGYNKKGELVNSKIIVPFDTTGNRGYTGIAVNCFETENECIAFYKKQVAVAIKGLQKHKKQITEVVDSKIAELKTLA